MHSHEPKRRREKKEKEEEEESGGVRRTFVKSIFPGYSVCNAHANSIPNLKGGKELGERNDRLMTSVKEMRRKKLRCLGALRRVRSVMTKRMPSIS